MSEPPIWPPPPNLPEPLSEHDDFLIACIRNSTSKPPLSRLRLVKNLHDETGRDVRSCLAVVNSFCNGHAILMPASGLATWLGCLLPLIYVGAMTAMGIGTSLLMRSQDAAVTHSAKLHFRAERMHLGAICLVIGLASISFNLLVVSRRQRKARIDAAEGKAKFE